MNTEEEFVRLKWETGVSNGNSSSPFIPSSHLPANNGHSGSHNNANWPVYKLSQACHLAVWRSTHLCATCAFSRQGVVFLEWTEITGVIRGAMSHLCEAIILWPFVSWYKYIKPFLLWFSGCPIYNVAFISPPYKQPFSVAQIFVQGVVLLRWLIVKYSSYLLFLILPNNLASTLHEPLPQAQGFKQENVTRSGLR